MPKIFAGTGYSQVIAFDPQNNPKHKEVFGAPARQPVLHLSHSPLTNLAIYSTPKTLTSIFKAETNQIAKVYTKETIVSANSSPLFDRVEYALSNGAIYEASATKVLRNEAVFQEVFKGEGHSGYVGGAQSQDESRCLFYGKGVVPAIVDKTHSLVSWRGKNVKHDELDLQVPINDVDGAFFRNGAFLSILNYNNKLRIYDVRGTHRRPVNDIDLKAAPRTNMVKLAVDSNDQICYVGNTIGQIFQLDARKDWASTAKFKGITTTVTGLRIGQGQLFVSSMDCYVRIFDIQEKSVVNKFYLNKPIYSLYVDCEDGHREEQQLGHFQEEQVNLDEEGQQQKKAQKIKQIRKRNKVSLKYLRPQEFDTPEEAELKLEEEALKKEEWYSHLNPIDRRDFSEEP